MVAGKTGGVLFCTTLKLKQILIVMEIMHRLDERTLLSGSHRITAAI